MSAHGGSVSPRLTRTRTCRSGPGRPAARAMHGSYKNKHLKRYAPFFSLWYSCRVCNPRKFFWIQRAPWSILFLAFSSAATYKIINKNDKLHPCTRIEIITKNYRSCILNWILERMMKNVRMLVIPVPYEETILCSQLDTFLGVYWIVVIQQLKY